MDFDGSTSAPPAVMYGEAMWEHLNLRGINNNNNNTNTNMSSILINNYPERPGELECAYYLRTGLCRYGATCRFNHPPDRQLAIAAARIKGEYPERPGQPECQYYLKTATCKFGLTCKFHHPKDKAGKTGRVLLNSIGYPFRPGETECAYYLKTLQCKFGPTCKFHHPDPETTDSTSSVIPTNSYTGLTTTNPVNSSNGVTTNPDQSSTYTTNITRAPFITSPQLIVPQGMVPLSNWTSYTTGEASMSYGTIHREDLLFPERPDQPECIYYMKTGDCKFGSNCKFDHPKNRSIPPPDCILSPIGLPLRPGEPVCKFYLRYGICKFGPNCKFDHPMATPMGLLTYGYSSTNVTGGSPSLAASSWPGHTYGEENIQSYPG